MDHTEFFTALQTRAHTKKKRTSMSWQTKSNFRARCVTDLLPPTKQGNL